MKNSALKNSDKERGFSLLEMSIGLSIVAATSILGVQQISAGLERKAADRIANEVTAMAEDVYTCYAAGDCRNLTTDEFVLEPRTDVNRGLPPKTLANVFLPVSTPTAPAPASSFVLIKYPLTNPTSPSTSRSGMKAKTLLGAAAEYVDGEIILTLGRPGTQALLAGAREKMLNEDLEFGGTGQSISNVQGIDAATITIGGISLDGAALARLLNPAEASGSSCNRIVETISGNGGAPPMCTTAVDASGCVIVTCNRGNEG